MLVFQRTYVAPMFSVPLTLWNGDPTMANANSLEKMIVIYFIQWNKPGKLHRRLACNVVYVSLSPLFVSWVTKPPRSHWAGLPRSFWAAEEEKEATGLGCRVTKPPSSWSSKQLMGAAPLSCCAKGIQVGHWEPSFRELSSQLLLVVTFCVLWHCCCDDDVLLWWLLCTLLSVIAQKNLHFWFLIPMLKYFCCIHKSRGPCTYWGNKKSCQKWLACQVIWYYHDFWHKILWHYCGN